MQRLSSFSEEAHCLSFEKRQQGAVDFLVPKRLSQWIPEKPPWPAWLFYERNFRYRFFQKQGPILKTWVYHVDKIETCLAQEASSLVQLQQCLYGLNQVEHFYALLIKNAKQAKVKGLLKFFYRKTNGVLETWLQILVHQQMVIQQMRLALCEKIAQDAPFWRMNLTVQSHENLGTFLKESERILPQGMQSRLQAVQQQYREHTNWLKISLEQLIEDIPNGMMFEKSLAQVLRFQLNMETLRAVEILRGVLQAKIPKNKGEIKAVEEALECLFEKITWPQEKRQKCYEILARHYLMPKVQQGQTHLYPAVFHWDKHEAVHYRQTHQHWLDDFLSMMNFIFKDCSRQDLAAFLKGAPLKVKLTQGTFTFTMTTLFEQIPLFYRKAELLPEYIVRFHTLLKDYLYHYAGDNLQLKPIFRLCADVTVYDAYLDKRFIYLVHQDTLWTEELIHYQRPRSPRYSAWCQHIQAQGFMCTSFNLSWYQGLIQFKEPALLQNYCAHILKLWLQGKLTDMNFMNHFPLNLAECLGEEEMVVWEYLVQKFLNQSHPQAHLSQVIDWLKQISTTFPQKEACIKQLEKRMLNLSLKQELHQFHLKSREFLKQGQYELWLNHLFYLYRQAKARDNQKEAFLKAYQREMQTLQKHIQNFIRRHDLNTPFNIQKRVIDRLPEAIKSSPSKQDLSLLCLHSEVYYLCYVDKNCSAMQTRLAQYVQQLDQGEPLYEEMVTIFSAFCRFEAMKPISKTSVDPSLVNIQARLQVKLNELYKTVCQQGQIYHVKQLKQDICWLTYFTINLPDEKESQDKLYQLIDSYILQYVWRQFTCAKRPSKTFMDFLEKNAKEKHEEIKIILQQKLQLSSLQKLFHLWWACFQAQVNQFNLNVFTAVSKNSIFAPTKMKANTLNAAHHVISQAENLEIKLAQVKTFLDTLKNHPIESMQLQSLLSANTWWMKIWIWINEMYVKLHHPPKQENKPEMTKIH